jgi:hypothetical protein
LLDLSGTPKDSSKDELGSGGQKEEVQQQEIDTSTTDYQVSTEPTPGSSILVDTSPTDEQQMEVEPSGTYEISSGTNPRTDTHNREPGKYSNLGRTTNPRAC